MKKIFALIFLVILSPVLGQNYVVSGVKIYDWETAKTASSDTIFGISFRKLKLTEVPNELKNYKNLQVLDLSKNKLVELPGYIGEFEFLEDLNLTKNKLEYYPLLLCKNSSIRFLRLGQNLFENLPNCLESLQKLEYLDLIDTPIRSLPESILRMKHLKEIDLTGIRFSPRFQESWIDKMPDVKLIFDAPCDCFE